MQQPNLFWVVVGSDALAACTMKPMSKPPRAGDRIDVDGNVCVVDRVGPPPPGSHVVTGTVYANRA